jgi:hypothetical protein
MATPPLDQPSERFLQAKESWHIEKLLADIGDAKKQIKANSKGLSPTEEAFMCLLLCGYGPDAIARECNRKVNGVKSDLSQGLYDYIEILVDKRPKDWRDISIWLEQRGYKIPHSSRSTIKGLHPDISNQFQALIADKTECFIGREYIFTAIANFLASHPNGYFTIIGKPGVGKSAILSRYVQQTNCVCYFNMRSQGLNRVGQFLESICKQLINRYSLPYPSLPPDATQDGNFLNQLLVESSSQLNPGEQLVIAIDALDEVELISQSDGSNILYLPTSLPVGVYFVMTQRPITLPLVVHTPQFIFDLMLYQNESLCDVKAYISNAVENLQLQTWINTQGLTGDEFIETLAQKSESNFMYLCYVLPDIERGIYQDLSIEKLPTGLQGYYENHWSRMGMTTKPLPRTKIRIIYVLAELRQPISRCLISECADEEELVVQEVLNEWKQFLHEQHIDNQSRYSVYHTSFNDFLHRKDIVQASGVTIKIINAQIANHLWEELFESE